MPTRFNHRPHRATIAALAVIATLAVAACGGSSSSSSSTSAASSASGSPSSTAATAPTVSASFPNYAAAAPPKFTPTAGPKSVALLMSNTEVSTTQSLLLGFQEAAKKDNIKLTVFNAGGFANVAIQVSQLETAIGEHPNVIVVNPTSPVALNAGIATAVSKGIKVLAVGIPPSAPQVAFSLYDPLPQDGATLATGLAKAIGGKGDIYRIFGGAGGAVATLTAQGALAALKKYPQIKVVYAKDFPSFSPADAQTAVENGLVAHPNVAGILSNDVSLGEGAYRALAAAGKGTVPVVGIGPSTPQDIQYLRSGKIAVTVSAPFYSWGPLTLQWALYILAGHKPKQRLIATQPFVLTKANIDQAISSGAFFKAALAPVTLGCGPGQPKQC